MEKFKQIENTNYLVSNTGKIINARTSRILRTNSGTACLMVNGKTKIIHVHREVALAFLPNPENHKVVAKKSGESCHVDNLYWTEKPISRNNSLTYIDVQVIRKAFKSGKLTIRELSEKYKTSASNITSIVYCRTWKHVGDDLQINL
jgi:hypothetical protein